MKNNKAKASICESVKKVHSHKAYRHRFGYLGHYIGTLILFLFSLVLIPLFVSFLILSPLYFWVYREKWISPKDFFHFDRHNLEYMSIFDIISCEYCEFANGTLQWTLAIANQIESEWCPVKNRCDPHCSKVKEWRKEYVDNEYNPEDLENYYLEHFLKSEDEAQSP